VSRADRQLRTTIVHTTGGPRRTNPKIFPPSRLPVNSGSRGACPVTSSRPLSAVVVSDRAECRRASLSSRSSAGSSGSGG
jgi:hypothetical protein